MGAAKQSNPCGALAPAANSPAASGFSSATGSPTISEAGSWQMLTVTPSPSFMSSAGRRPNGTSIRLNMVAQALAQELAQDPLQSSLSDAVRETSKSVIEAPETTLSMLYITTVLTSVGITLLTIPGLVMRVGVAPGFALLLFPAVVSMATCRQLVALTDASTGESYASVVHFHLGRHAGTFAFASVILTTFLATSSGIALCMDVLPELIGGVDRILIALAVSGVVVPIASCKTLRPLQVILSKAFLAIIYLVLVIVLKSVKGGRVQGTVSAAVWSDYTAVALAAAQMGYSAELSLVTCYVRLGQAKKPRAIRAVDAGLFTCFVLYLAVGYAGYLQHGANVRSNYLLNLGAGAWGTSAKVVITIVTALRLPIFSMITSHAMTDRVQCLGRRADWLSSRLAFSMVFFATACGVAIGLNDMALIIALVGGSAGLGVNVVLPSLAWLAAAHRGDVRNRLLSLAACSLLAGAALFECVFLYGFTRALVHHAT